MILGIFGWALLQRVSQRTIKSVTEPMVISVPVTLLDDGGTDISYATGGSVSGLQAVIQRKIARDGSVTVELPATATTNMVAKTGSLNVLSEELPSTTSLRVPIHRVSAL
jgi:hypothetical protein